MEPIAFVLMCVALKTCVVISAVSLGFIAGTAEKTVLVIRCGSYCDTAIVLPPTSPFPRRSLSPIRCDLLYYWLPCLM